MIWDELAQAIATDLCGTISSKNIDLAYRILVVSKENYKVGAACFFCVYKV